MGVLQEMHQKIEPLMKEAQKGGNPEEIRPKAMKIREAHARRIEALLSDAQRTQWQKMLAKPLDLGD
jgi:vacuolar-type H+-ATPase subunit H